jgi:hypothetical protein
MTTRYLGTNTVDRLAVLCGGKVRRTRKCLMSYILIHTCAIVRICPHLRSPLVFWNTGNFCWTSCNLLRGPTNNFHFFGETHSARVLVLVPTDQTPDKPPTPPSTLQQVLHRIHVAQEVRITWFLLVSSRTPSTPVLQVLCSELRGEK